MKKFLLPLLLLVAANCAFGALCTTYTDLNQLIGAGSCTVSSLTFSNFTYTPGGNTPPSGAGQIGVAFTPAGAITQIDFNPAFSVTSGQNSDVKIGYTVSGGIAQIILGFSAESHTNGEVNSVTENYWVNCNSSTPGISCGPSSGTLIISTSNTTFASVNLPANKSVTVTKDILADATGVSGISGEVGHISGVVNGLVTPEPMTLGLMGFGLLAVGVFGRRVKK